MKTALIIMVVLGLFLGGCATVCSSGAFGSDGLPKQEYYVGGGFNLHYQAKMPGTVYVVEEISGKLLITESVGIDHPYELSIDPSDEDHLARLMSMGMNPEDIKLGLYFVPSKE
jgi:hypothetical protein